MPKPKKSYKIKISHTRRPDRFIDGTIAELLEDFSYNFLVGKQYNSKINTNPKTIKSFISNLEKSYDEMEGGYERTFFTLIKN